MMLPPGMSAPSMQPPPAASAMQAGPGAPAPPPAAALPGQPPPAPPPLGPPPAMTGPPQPGAPAGPVAAGAAPFAATGGISKASSPAFDPGLAAAAPGVEGGTSKAGPRQVPAKFPQVAFQPSAPQPGAERRWVLDNRNLHAPSEGLGYRTHKNWEARAVPPRQEKWGAMVIGLDEGDGWLKVGELYLPMTAGNVPVIFPLEDQAPPAPPAPVAPPPPVVQVGPAPSQTVTASFGPQAERLGLELFWDGPRPTVGQVPAGSEAYAQGVQTGDVLMAANGTDTLNRRSDELMVLLKARPLELQFQRG